MKCIFIVPFYYVVFVIWYAVSMPHKKKNEKTAEIYGWNSLRYVLVVWLAVNQPDTFVLRIADNRRSVMILVELDSLETSSKHIKIMFAVA